MTNGSTIWHADSNNPDNKDISIEIKKVILQERNSAINTAVIEYKKQIEQLDSMIQELSDKIVTQEIQIDAQNNEISAINEQLVAKLAVLQAQVSTFDAQKLELKEQIIEIRNNLDLAIKEKHESARQTAIWQTKYEQLHGEMINSAKR